MAFDTKSISCNSCKLKGECYIYQVIDGEFRKEGDFEYKYRQRGLRINLMNNIAENCKKYTKTG